MRQDPNFCPMCGERYESICKCPHGDRECARGHHWHVCVIHKRIVAGASDHSTNTFTCTCKEKTDGD